MNDQDLLDDPTLPCSFGPDPEEYEADGEYCEVHQSYRHTEDSCLWNTQSHDLGVVNDA